MRVARYKRVHPKTRCFPSRRGRTESASGISLGSTDAPTARFWTSKMESNALYDESTWMPIMLIEEKRETKTGRCQNGVGPIFSFTTHHHTGVSFLGCERGPHAPTEREIREKCSLIVNTSVLGRADEWIWKLKKINDSLRVLKSLFLISSEILFIKYPICERLELTFKSSRKQNSITLNPVCRQYILQVKWNKNLDHANLEATNVSQIIANKR